MVQVEDKEGMVFCDCGAEGILVRYNEEDDLTFLSIWEEGQKYYKPTLGYRLKLIWRAFRYGTFLGDQIILNKAGRSRLIEILTAQGKVNTEPIFETSSTDIIKEHINTYPSIVNDAIDEIEKNK